MRKLTGYVTDREGNAVAGAEVYIRDQGDNSLVDLFSDDGSTATANPLSTDNDGEWSAFFADNTVKIQIFTEGVQQQEVNNYQHFDLDGLADPGADRIAFWDESAGAITYLQLGTGLSITDTTLDVETDLSTIAGLADPNADRILFWDDSAGSYAYLAPSTGIVISTTNLAIDEASAANIRANTADKVISTDAMWAAAAFVALTPGTNVATDLSTGINFTLAMGGNYTLDNPTNGKAGQQGMIEITQDATGSRTLAFGSNWKFAGGVDPVLSTDANAIDLLYFEVLSGGTNLYANLVKGIA